MFVILSKIWSFFASSSKSFNDCSITLKVFFHVFKNGKYLKTITDRNIVVPAKNNVDLYTVISSQNNLPCLPGTPVRTDNKKNTTFYEAENAVVSGGKISQSENPETFNVSADLIATIPNGTGFVEKWGSSEGEEIKFYCNAKKSGNYLVYFRFKNGHGPINTGEKCAVAGFPWRKMRHKQY